MGRKLKINFIKDNTYCVVETIEDFDEVSLVNVFEGSFRECNEFVINNR